METKLKEKIMGTHLRLNGHGVTCSCVGAHRWRAVHEGGGVAEEHAVGICGGGVVGGGEGAVLGLMFIGKT